MQEIKFHKYQGTGNDFVVIDNRNHIVDRKDESIAVRLCNRKFGVGSDGLILIEDHPDYDFEMVFFNPDGSQSMCGNGSRCAVMFAKELGIIDHETTFLSTDGVHTATISGNIVNLSMQDVSPEAIKSFDNHHEINTGSPHYVLFTSNLKEKHVKDEGAAIRYNPTFKEQGINVNFVEKQGKEEISVRTYERGVEDETLSCGTGVTACAIAHALHGGTSPVKVNTLGGQLEVSFELIKNRAEKVFLKGPAKKVFDGTIII
ncbi:diaminopimelate epimerase [Marivirga atlantica]|jgi:diaminopimelate epimerase|uniref:Diaminopimelate epimerase n=1 Tax=Marivirga atlantica TaxID=1548457 RepID=A0A937DDL7_9BACT|nr:diaminopimelate epimerase [Marivirga atlantica]MBL0764357.1 diaminopimelate epimerase [Marivirga atlantica]